MVPFHLLIITQVKRAFKPSLSSELHQRSIKQQISDNEIKASRAASVWMS